jgi:AraC family transcriptional regulator, melibiose operon regulatory protein
MRRPDRHNELELNFVSEGSVTYLLGGRLARVEAGRLTAFWAAVPHQIVAYEGQSEYYVVTIPLAHFLRLRLPEHFVHALVHGEMISAATDLTAGLTLLRLSDWERDLGAKATEEREATCLEIEAQLRRLCARYRSERAPGPSLKRPRYLAEAAFSRSERIAQVVADRYAEPIEALEVCRQVDPQPRRALKVFQATFGTSLPRFLTEYRLAQAQRLLVTTSMRIIDVSESVGFGSLGRFNRAFLQACGCAPREYRRRHALRPGGTTSHAATRSEDSRLPGRQD